MASLTPLYIPIKTGVSCDNGAAALAATPTHAKTPPVSCVKLIFMSSICWRKRARFSAVLSITVAACSSALFVPVTASVNCPSCSVPCTRARAALAFSMPNSLLNSAESLSTGFNSSSRSFRLLLLSPNASTSMPARSSSSRVSLGRKRPCESIERVLRKATPPSLPFLPALSST